MSSQSPTNNPSSSRLDDAAFEEKLRQARGTPEPWSGSPPPRPHRGFPKPTPGPYPKNHGGPIRIVSLADGTLTEYGKKLERERLARLTTGGDERGQTKDEDSGEVEGDGRGKDVYDGEDRATGKEAVSHGDHLGRRTIGATSFQDLPPNLIEQIVLLLPVRDVCALRLTGKVLASKATQEHFQTHFRTQKLEFTEARLRLFVSLTDEHSGLVFLLNDLTLVEPVYNTHELEAQLEDKFADAAVLDNEGRFVELGDRELMEDELYAARDLEVLRQRRKEQLEFQQSGRAIELLGQAFSNLVRHGTKLRQLRTEVSVYRDDAVTRLLPLYGGSWKYIWSAAARVTKLLFSSLAASGLSAETLNFFDSSRMQRCSLSCNELSEVDYSSDGLRDSLAKVEALSLSLSVKVIVRSDMDKTSSEDRRSAFDVTHREDRRSEEEVLNEAQQEASFAGLQKLLHTSHQLRELDVHRYTLSYADNDVTLAHCKGILSTLETAKLPMLQRLALRGFYVTEHQLVNILQTHRTLRKLSLRCITILEGMFEPVLNYCTLESSIDEVELDGLFEAEMVIFQPQRAPTTTSVPARSLPYPGAYRRWVRSQLDDTEDRRIKYHLDQGRTKDTSATRDWRQDLKNRYGPPGYGVLPCVRDHLRPEQTWRV